MGAIASQITSVTIVYSTVYSDASQRKYQSSATLAFVRGIHRGPVNYPHKWPVTRKMFPFDDVIMIKMGSRSLVCNWPSSTTLSVDTLLTYWAWDKMVASLPMTFSNYFAVWKLCFVTNFSRQHIDMGWCRTGDKPLSEPMATMFTDAICTPLGLGELVRNGLALVVGLRPALEGFVVTMHEGACETGSQIPTA